METISLYELLHMTAQEITLDDMKRITPKQIYYFKARYKTPPCCPNCRNLLQTGPGFFPCDTVATCTACNWKRDNQRLVTLIEYFSMEGAAAA